MTDDNVDQPGNPLGPEFSGTVEAGLGAMRARLLDLTARDRLLNFRHSPKSMLRIVHVGLVDVYEKILDGDSLHLEPVPDPPPVEPAPVLLAGEPPTAESQRPPAVAHAGSLGWETSYDLDEVLVPSARSLRVLLCGEALDSVSRRIGSAARTAIEELGTNTVP